jgi:cytochrome c peroxidase
MGMAGQEKKLFQELKQDPTYKKLFTQAFPEEAKKGEEKLYSLSTLTKAIASFERSLLSFNSPYDQYKYGKKNGIKVGKTKMRTSTDKQAAEDAIGKAEKTRIGMRIGII